MRCSGLDIMSSSSEGQELTLSRTSFKALPPDCEMACMCFVYQLGNLNAHPCGVTDRQGTCVCLPGYPVLCFYPAKQKPVPSA